MTSSLGIGAKAEEPDEEQQAEPIELLVQLAEDGEIDPWDIDIVEVTEEFLAALDEGDLRRSGRALFYASVLLRMKSDRLLEPEEEDPPEEPPDPAPFERPPAEFQDDPVASLEAEMDRRLERKRARGTPETLDELIRELREAERGSWWKESREYDTTGNNRYDEGPVTLNYHADDAGRALEEPTADEVTDRTHDEEIEDVIERVKEAIVSHYDSGRNEILFAEVSTVGESRVQTFLALLFLANRDVIQLQQDELFDDLWIQDPGVDADTTDSQRS